MEFQASTSHDTALCLIPPKEQWPQVDRLRFDNDKAFSKWPPHVNLVYPFAKSADDHVLREACDCITSALKARPDLTQSGPVSVRLDSPGSFSHKHGNTLFLYDKDEERTSQLKSLRETILTSIGQTRSDPYNMHMTIAQCDDTPNSSRLNFMLEKLRRLPPVSWEASQLAVLVRGPSGQMRPWGLIDLVSSSLTLCEASSAPTLDILSAVVPQPTWQFSQQDLAWKLLNPTEVPSPDDKSPENLIVASWNVLAEFLFPPSRARYSLIVDNLLAETALADVVVLQEVTDDFLPFLLEERRIQRHYPYATHGSPDDPAAGPLPNILNVVVLSKYPFTWEYLPSRRQHKGSCILKFEGLGHTEADQPSLPLVLATCHLSQGLTDGAVVKKEKELQRILGHLKSNYTSNQWVVAGDFNIATSSYTIDTAVTRGAITTQTETVLRSIETTLAEAGLLDVWMVSRVEAGVSDHVKGDVNDLFEGEQGATFDPRENPHAAKMVGSGLNNRPQRYDRILVKSAGPYHISRFNMFGFTVQTAEDDPEGSPLYPSDHWGIRCLLRRFASTDGTGMSASVVPVELKRAPAALSDPATLKQCMERLGVTPTAQDEFGRKQALQLLEQIILETEEATEEQIRSRPSIVLVPVGSYGLGVWSKTSDIDCLFVGSISPRIFFTLARQRLRKTTTSGVRLLRKVKAKSGTMLEVEILGIKCDVQYCQAASVANQWPDLLKRPPSDPVFSLPTQTLLKLKPARDLFYFRRSIPDLAQFRTCFHVIKTWAKARGIYAAKFGYLGGIHLSVMLVRVCKMLLHDGGVVSTTDIITTFFNHYSRVDWKNDIIFDPFFHRQLRYHRTPREAMCLLGWHSPTLNTALVPSVPTVKIISRELQQADAQLSGEVSGWESLLSAAPGPDLGENMTPAAANFLSSFRTFVNLRIHYWGGSLERGSRLVGWLESRCASLLVDINRRVPELSARIWPGRFVEASAQDSQSDYQGSYLVGLEWMSEDEKPTKDNLETAHSNLRAVLQQFEQHILGDEKYFDPITSWFSATLVKGGGQLDSLRLDDREWGEYVDGDDESDSEDEEEEEDDVEALELLAEKKKGKKQQRPTVPKPEGAGKLRTALDVLNRLRWDPNIDSNDYLIGYEDRFLGPQEKALGAWKSEQTDEEFIPQHRILWFKRRSDDVVVWNRSERIDLLFKKL